jgi:hypothetical protein
MFYYLNALRIMTEYIYKPHKLAGKSVLVKE